MDNPTSSRIFLRPGKEEQQINRYIDSGNVETVLISTRTKELIEDELEDGKVRLIEKITTISEVQDLNRVTDTHIRQLETTYINIDIPVTTEDHQFVLVFSGLTQTNCTLAEYGNQNKEVHITTSTEPDNRYDIFYKEQIIVKGTKPRDKRTHIFKRGTSNEDSDDSTDDSTGEEEVEDEDEEPIITNQSIIVLEDRPEHARISKIPPTDYVETPSCKFQDWYERANRQRKEYLESEYIRLTSAGFNLAPLQHKKRSLWSNRISKKYKK